jgi:hypothetical protein
LPTSFLKLPTYISKFLRACHDGLLSGGELVPNSCKALLCLRQLLLQVRQALGLSFDGTIDLASSLFGSLQGLLRRIHLRLGLLTGLVDLRQLLLSSLIGLLQGGELALNLVARLRGLRDLLLGSRDLRLELTLLPINLGLELTLLLLQACLL